MSLSQKRWGNMDVTITGVQKSFGDVQALKPIDLKFRDGQFTTLLGPSGCGKTTLLRMVAGLETPDQGEIYLAEECIFSATKRMNKPTHHRKIGMVFQDFALWPHMSVFENIAFGLRASGQTKQLKDQVQHALDVVRLNGFAERFPHQLSGGQQQRVAFARAIVNQPKLVLFDEPLSALDATLREEMRLELMTLVRKMGLTALYVTHDQIEAMSMSDVIVVMQNGEILQQGKPEQVYKQPLHRFVAGFIGKANWLDQDVTMFRPEHIRWSGDARDLSWLAKIRHVSYVGDRYEISLDMGVLGHWIAYHHKRLSVGEQVKIFVSQLDIHQMNENQLEAIMP